MQVDTFQCIFRDMKQKKIKVQISETVQDNELDAPISELIKAAKDICQQAYSVYSGFSVGAAVLLDDGTIIRGNNQENAAYPSGLCAERVALFYANANYPDRKVMAIAVTAQKNGHTVPEPTPPCGGCRQVLFETERRYNQSMKVYLVGTEVVSVFDSAAELLPLAFDHTFLKS
jgi:cytidine deaminase